MARRSKASQALDEVEGLREEEEWEDEEEQGQAFDFNKYTITSNVETKVLEIDVNKSQEAINNYKICK